MAIVMGAFFGVIIAVNVIMAVVATGSWTGLVVANSYVASQGYNKLLAEARVQNALGWQSTLAYDGRNLVFDVRDQHDTAVTDLMVTARLSIPAHEHRDHDVQLRQTGDGAYGGAATLEPGLWQADVTATNQAGEKYRQVFRFMVKQGR